MLRRFLHAATAALALAAAACGDSSPAEPVYSDPATAVYAPSVGVDLAAMTRTGTGLYIRDVAVGTGALATTSSTVTVTYAGHLPTGRRFDSGTRQFPLTGVVAGFREGIAGMRVGGERKLVLPPALGYGATPPQGSGIPANSVLVFDVKLVSIP
jgi:peptidylprolyl isomerase